MNINDFMNKSITELTQAEKNDYLILCKNLLSAITNKCTEAERAQIMQGGCTLSNIPTRFL